MRRWRAGLTALSLACCAAAPAIAGADHDRRPAPAHGDAPLLGFNDAVVGELNGVSAATYVRITRAIGGNALRTNIDWRHAEPQRDVWDERWWRLWTDFYTRAVEAGVRPIFVIGMAPSWAQPLGLGCGEFAACETPPTREMNAEWAEYAAEVAVRFPRAMIEVWNEPNSIDFWRIGPDPERFAELQAIAYDAIKAASPRTAVVSGGLLNLPTSPARGDLSIEEFLARAYAATPSLRGHADLIGLHPYPAAARVGPDSRFRRSFRAVRGTQEAAGDRTPVLVTELGISNLGAVTQARQASALMAAHRHLRSMREVAGVVYHRPVEPFATTAVPREIGYAWLTYGTLAPRPVFCAFVAAAGRGYPGC